MSAARGSHLSGSHLSTSVVVVVVILSVVLVLSGLLHLLARCLGRRRQRGRAVSVREQGLLVSALHGQLQQLFHLHDAGVEQAFIDTLPVFCYSSIRGLKDSTDCAVCLTEFGDDDRLRLLPKCKHAFHVDCIDTWLLSNSTCPLCRRSLLPVDARHCHSGPLLGNDIAMGASTSVSPEEQSRRTTTAIASYRTSFRICDDDDDDSDHDEIQEMNELEHDMQREIEEVTPRPVAPTIRVMDVDGTQRVLKVELGRVASRPQSDSRQLAIEGARSYSMGSYEYIVDSASWELRMAPTPYPGRPQDWAPSKPTHRTALSDSIPELASAGDELFWISRGLYNPHTLSRIRELLTPSGSEGFSSPFMDYPDSPVQGDRWIDVEECLRPQDDVEECVRPQDASDIQQRSSSLSRLPSEAVATASLSCFRRSLSETSAGMEQAAKCAATALRDETLKQQGSLSRRFSLNWLMGRDKRMIFAAASPVVDVELQRSTSIAV